MKYWNLTFKKKLHQAPPHSLGITHTKIRPQIEVLDQKTSRFRPVTVGRHTSTSRLLSLILLTVGQGCRSLCASYGGRGEISTHGLIVFVWCLAAPVCQTAQGNMIWAGVVLVFDWRYLEFASFDIACILNLSQWYSFIIIPIKNFFSTEFNPSTTFFHYQVHQLVYQ